MTTLKPKAFFKLTKGDRGPKYRFEQIRPGTSEGYGLDVEHLGANHVLLDFRKIHKTSSGRKGNKRVFMHAMDAQFSVQLASILFKLADESLRSSDESPYYSIVSTPEKASMGPNWIKEDYESASRRVFMRESRSYTYNLMKQFIETCQDEALFLDLAHVFIEWGNESENPYLKSIADKARNQLTTAYPDYD